MNTNEIEVFWDDDDELPEGSQLFLDANRGVYIPQAFAQQIETACLSGVSQDDMRTLRAGPKAEWYWEAWDNVINNALITDRNGVKYRLHTDGDLWIVPID